MLCEEDFFMEFYVIVPILENSASWYQDLLEESSLPSILKHIHSNAKQSGAVDVVLVTDNSIISDVAEKNKLRVFFIEKEEASVTEKVGEVVDALELDDDEIVVCLDAENALLNPKFILSLADDLEQHVNLKVASLCEPITKINDMEDHSIVKVILNKRQHAMYFTRSPIPSCHKEYLSTGQISLPKGQCYRHVGVYAFRVGFLQTYTNWTPCALEKIELLEQLRILYNGARIHVRVSDKPLTTRIKSLKDFSRKCDMVT